MRKDETERCMGIIGWTWPKLAERLDISYGMALSIKGCKREIADSDLLWLQDLAAAVGAIPRPPVVNDLSAVQTSQGDASMHAAADPVHEVGNVGLGLAPLRPEMGAGGQLLAEAVGAAKAEVRDAAVYAIVGQYQAVELENDWSPEEKGAARAALAGVLSSLGWLEQGKALLAERTPKQVGGAPAPKAPTWALPQPAGGVIGRVPLG